VNKETIRLIDRTLGSLLCFLLTLARRATDLLGGKRAASRPPTRILFIKLIEQGATVLAHTAVQRAAAKVGRDNLFFIVFAENRAIIDILDMVPTENVIEVRHRNLFVFGWDILKALARCRREKIDCTIDMEFLARAPAILAYLIGAGRRVGLHRFSSEAPYRGDLMTERVQYNPYLHTAENYALLVEALDAPPGESPLRKIPAADLESPAPRFHASDDERERVAGLIDELAGRRVAGPILLLNPNAGDLLPLRRWDTDRFVELGRQLLEEYPDATIGVTGAPSERAAAEAVASRIGEPPRVITFAGNTTLRELLVLYTFSDVLVTNDSGPGHFASLTDIHNVVMFGPETPRLFGPRGGNPHVVFADLACSPCVNVLNHRFSPCSDDSSPADSDIQQYGSSAER
jgi:ADP-heptose:LPS heptosyltransferase